MKIISSSHVEFCGFQGLHMISYQSTTHIVTKEGSSYIRKLCKHFVHKVPVSYTETTGRAELPTGLCLMQANDSELVFTITADTTEGIAKAEDVVVRHLVQFAFREQLVINWHRETMQTAAIY